MNPDRLARLPAGVPYPLWVTVCDASQHSLLPDACQPYPGRRSWLLLALRSGRLQLLRGGQTCTLDPGQALLVPHPDAQLALAPEQADWSAIAFGFVGFDELSAELTEREQTLHLPGDGWAMRQLLALTDDESWSLQTGAAFRLVSGILANLVEHNLIEEERDAPSQQLRRAVEALHAAVERDVNLGMLARELDISLGHLSRLFRQHLGCTPKQYLHDRRMRRACELLRDGELDVQTIASRLGYSTQSAFTAAFRGSTGMTPTDFRNSRSVPVWRGER